MQHCKNIVIVVIKKSDDMATLQVISTKLEKISDLQHCKIDNNANTSAKILEI